LLALELKNIVMKKSFKVLVLIVILLLSNKLYSQWQSSSNGIANPIAICFAESSGTIICGHSNGIYTTTDFGNFWQLSNSGITSANKMVSCLCSNSAGVYAGNVNYLYFSNDNGTSWSQIYDFGSNIFLEKFAVHNDTIYAATNGGGVLMSADNGLNWTSLNAGLPSNNILTIIEKGPYLFAGTDSNGVYMSSNSGATWTSTNVGLTPFKKIYCLETDGNNIFAGVSIVSTFYYKFGYFISSDNGATWVQDSNGLPTSKRIVNILSVGNVLLAASIGIYRSLDDGATWSSFIDGIDTLSPNSACEFFESSSYIFCSFEANDNNLVYRIPKNEVLSVPDILNNNQTCSLSPNPTPGPILIQLPQSFGKVKSLDIYNCMGQLQTTQSEVINVDISGFSDGLYFIVVTNDMGVKTVAKVIKD
jgi:ligand-binding sensor domain-containing protein